MQKKKQRLDGLLVERGLCGSRSRAKALILAGKVRAGTEVLDKPGKTYARDAEITLVQPPRYVSRGGEKLDAYLQAFPTKVNGLRFLDVGASTGGFTDCLLQRGAKQAVCVDVGRAQMHQKLLQDERVTNLEKVNARHLHPADLPYPDYNLIVTDLSFISLTKVLPATWPLLRPQGKMIILVKPQFEANKAWADKGKGVIRDPNVRRQVLEDMQNWIQENLHGASLEGHLESPIAGGDGNLEYLVGIIKGTLQAKTAKV
tara:strand:- start:9495 stop:10271 length:777 start_codon:yes stop_codon:yes gene_type:complete